MRLNSKAREGEAVVNEEGLVADKRTADDPWSARTERDEYEVDKPLVDYLDPVSYLDPFPYSAADLRWDSSSTYTFRYELEYLFLYSLLSSRFLSNCRFFRSLFLT